MNSTKMKNIDKDKISTLMQEADDNVNYFESITNQLVDSYTRPLDNIMKNIYKDIINVEEPTIEILEKYFLELSNCIYFMGEKLEKLGIYTAVSKTSAKEVYNNAYLDAQLEKIDGKKPTVAELTATAESESVYENTLNDIYNRSYAIMKNKIQAAGTMISTLSKTISRRMSEMQLSSIQPTSVGRQLLNEEVY